MIQPSRSATASSFFPLLTLVLISLACAPKPTQEPELETVEIGPGATAMLVPEGDITQTTGAGSFAGQLPADFPKGLPAPASSSVTGQGPGIVSFGTNDAATAVKQELEPELARAGWHKIAGGGFTKGNRTVRISFSEDGDRTTITYRY